LEAIRDVASIARPVRLVGAWMTRTWLLSAGPLPSLRRTNDVDIGLAHEAPGSSQLKDGLARLGYAANPDFRFRVERMGVNGLLIIDFLIDQSRAQEDKDAYPVYGLDFALHSLVAFVLRLKDFNVECEVAVPSLDRAVILRVLALDGGADTAKFADYAKDAAALAVLCADGDGFATEVLRSEEFARAKGIASDLFGDFTKPGSREAVGVVALDPELAARRASAAMRSLFGH